MDIDIYKEKIKPLLDGSGKTDRFLEDAIGLPRGIIYKWEKGKNKNFKFYITEIAAYFNVSTDYLLGNTDDPAPVGQTEKLPAQYGEQDAEVQELIRLFDLASPELRAAALAVLKSAEAAQKAQDGAGEGK